MLSAVPPSYTDVSKTALLVYDMQRGIVLHIETGVPVREQLLDRRVEQTAAGLGAALLLGLQGADGGAARDHWFAGLTGHLRAACRC